MEDQMSITLPDGNEVRSMHQCILDLLELPEDARKGHIIHYTRNNIKIPNIACDAMQYKMQRHIQKNNVMVKHEGKIVLQGRKCKKMGL